MKRFFVLLGSLFVLGALFAASASATPAGGSSVKATDIAGASYNYYVYCNVGSLSNGCTTPTLSVNIDNSVKDGGAGVANALYLNVAAGMFNSCSFYVRDTKNNAIVFSATAGRDGQRGAILNNVYSTYALHLNGCAGSWGSMQDW